MIYLKKPARISAAGNRIPPRKLLGKDQLFTNAQWEALKRRYKYRCVRCSRKETPENPLTRDHVIPTIMGGSPLIDNIQPLCWNCNQTKKDGIKDYRGRKFKN